MTRIGTAIAGLIGAIGLQACAYDSYAYAGEDYAGFDASDRLDPWLADTEEGQRIVHSGFQNTAGPIDEATADRINVWFRRYADTDRDLRLTDEEIRVALIQASRDHRVY